MPVRSRSLSALAVLSPTSWQLVEVSGPSMVPALRHGDRVLARRVAGGRAVRPGDVVLGRFRDMPDRLVVKRAVRRADGGWWLSSDNPFARGDSSSHGAADVTARVLWRVAPGRPRRLRRDVPGAVRDWDGRANPET